jgi:hypothetical protein
METTVQPKKLTRHMAIYEALKRLQYCTKRLNRFHHSLTENCETDEDEPEEKKTPTFMEVLTSAPDIINDNCEKINTFINDTENLLF